MAKIEFASLAEHVRAEGGIAHALGLGLDTLIVPSVPVGANMGLVARIAFTRNECSRPHRIELIFQDVDGHHLLKMQAVVEPEWREDIPPGWNLGILWAMNFGVVLPAFGLYSVDLLLNDNEDQHLNFRVVEPK